MYTTIGWLFPLNICGGKASTSNASCTWRYVSGPINISLPGATPQMREAKLTASPITVYSTRPSDPTFPARALPVLIPMPNQTADKVHYKISPFKKGRLRGISKSPYTLPCHARDKLFFKGGIILSSTLQMELKYGINACSFNI
jgi:hypothetical protein